MLRYFSFLGSFEVDDEPIVDLDVDSLNPECPEGFREVNYVPLCNGGHLKVLRGEEEERVIETLSDNKNWDGTRRLMRWRVRRRVGPAAVPDNPARYDE